MKELTIEEKAQRYDEAIKRVKKIKTGKCETTFVFTEGLFEYIFSELAESEDERIRKGIIRNLEYLMDRAEGFVKNELKERIAWLKKQGEHTEWSEEDKKMIINICKNLYDYPRVNSPFDNNSFKEAQKQVDWFKSRVQPRQE